MRTPIVFAFALSLAGCGDSRSLPPDAAPTSDEFLQQFGEAFCRRVTACAPTEAPLFCPLMSTGLECLARAVSQGLVPYHGESANDCLAEVAALRCDDVHKSGDADSLEACNRTLEAGAGGSIHCDADGGVTLVPTDGGVTPDADTSLPAGDPCDVLDGRSVEACGQGTCHECLTTRSGHAGVCVESCTVSKQDCPNGKTCRSTENFGYTWTGTGCGDGYCD